MGGVIVWVLSVLTLCEVNIKRAVKVRIALGKVKQAKEALFKTFAIRERD